MTGCGWIRDDGLEAIAAIREPWQAAAERQARNRPFSGPGFVLSALRAYHASDRPALVRAGDGTTWLGALPLVRRPLRRFGHTVEECGLPDNPNVISSDPLIAAAAGVDQREVVAALIEGAFATGADTLIADNLPTDDGLPELFHEAAAMLGVRADAPRPARALSFATLGCDWESYLATRSRDHRWQIRKTLRNAGGLVVERHSGADAIRRMLPDWFAIERRSWQGSHPDTAMREPDRRFHALLLDELEPDEIGDLWIVRRDRTPVAALRMLAAAGRVSVHTMHFDAASQALAPGLIAFASMMRDACMRGLAEVDMHGTTSFFARWATGARAHASLRLYRRGARGHLLQRGRGLARTFDQSIASANAGPVRRWPAVAGRLRMLGRFPSLR